MDTENDKITDRLPEYELSGIENISRGVCVCGGRVLLCRPKSGMYSYLPGGHIEFGETSREALVREMEEETGLKATAGDLLGVVESSFEQRGKRHCEISLVYRMEIVPTSVESDAVPNNSEGRAVSRPPEVTSRESWIEFIWQPIDRLDEVNLLPQEMKGIVVG